MLGTELGLAGVSPMIIDTLLTLSGQAKGAGVQPRTVEVFDLRGMADQLLEKALPREPISGHFGGLPVELDYRPWNTRHPYLVSIPQDRIEQLLTERLADCDISVYRGHELIGCNCDDDGVTATVHDRATDADVHVRARYLVACDGGHSTVRALVGVPFPGQAGTRPAVLAEVRLTSISDLVPRRISHFAAMVRDGGGYWSMLSPLEGDLYRLVFGPLTRPSSTVADQRCRAP